MYSLILAATVLAQSPEPTESYFTSKNSFPAILKETVEKPEHLHVFTMLGRVSSRPVNAATGRSAQKGHWNYRVVSPYGFDGLSVKKIFYELRIILSDRLNKMGYEGEAIFHEFPFAYGMVQLKYKGRSIEGNLFWIFKLEDNGIINIDEFTEEE